MTSRVTGPDWLPEGLEQYNGSYPLGLEYHDEADAGDLYALVRLEKYCSECRRVFVGWEFQARIESIRAVPHPKEPEREIVLGICDACVEQWETARERRKLEFTVENLRKRLGRTTQRKAVLVVGRDLLTQRRRLRDLYPFGSRGYTEATEKIEELEKTLSAVSVMGGVA